MNEGGIPRTTLFRRIVPDGGVHLRQGPLDLSATATDGPLDLSATATDDPADSSLAALGMTVITKVVLTDGSLVPEVSTINGLPITTSTAATTIVNTVTPLETNFMGVSPTATNTVVDQTAASTPGSTAGSGPSTSTLLVAILVPIIAVLILFSFGAFFYWKRRKASRSKLGAFKPEKSQLPRAEISGKVMRYRAELPADAHHTPAELPGQASKTMSTDADSTVALEDSLPIIPPEPEESSEKWKVWGKFKRKPQKQPSNLTQANMTAMLANLEREDEWREMRRRVTQRQAAGLQPGDSQRMSRRPEGAIELPATTVAGDDAKTVAAATEASYPFRGV